MLEGRKEGIRCCALRFGVLFVSDVDDRQARVGTTARRLANPICPEYAQNFAAQNMPRICLPARAVSTVITIMHDQEA